MSVYYTCSHIEYSTQRELKQMGLDGMKHKYHGGNVTDVDMLAGVKEEFDRLTDELKEAEEELKKVRRLILKHRRRKDDELFFYLGARMREIELKEEISCLVPEIDALAVKYMVGVAMLNGKYGDGA